MSYLSNRQYGLLSHRRLIVKLKNSSSITKRLVLDHTLDVHRGCVNTIWWNEYGTTILSGSDDQNLIVTDPFTQKVLTKVHSGHRENIFSAKFLPETNDRHVVSCSGDGVIFHTNFDRPNTLHSNEGCFTCHGSATAYEVKIIPHTPNLFLSCSDDCTVRLYDLRTKSNCLKSHCNDDVLIRSNWGITSMDINPMNSNEIVCACSDSSVRLYDHRKLSTQISSTSHQCESSINGLISYFMLSNQKEQHRSRITSVVFNQYGTEILASYSSESLYLLDSKQTISQEQMKEHLIEHKNQKQTKTNNNNKSSLKNTQNKENQTTPIKRVRLRSGWSDTGPNSQPSNEEQTEVTTNPSESTNEQQSSTTSSQNSQNSFMQRMSDILTQLVTPPTSATEQTNEETETTTTTTTNNIQTNETTTVPDNDSASFSTTNSPTAQSPTSIQNSATITNNNDNADDESDRVSILDLIFGGVQRFRTDEHDDDANNMDDDDDDDEDSQETITDNIHLRRTCISTKWDRMKKRRETERSYEENLLKNIPSLNLLNSYDGHRNARTMIKEANFWSDSYVMSGSDCGHIFIWNKFTGNIVRIIPADEHVVNCIQPHPLNYPILASSGIDYNIKIFSPLAETPIDDSDRINHTVKRNHTMTEETSNTITIPASFMFRMLTSIYRLRHPEEMSGLDDDD